MIKRKWTVSAIVDDTGNHLIKELDRKYWFKFNAVRWMKHMNVMRFKMGASDGWRYVVLNEEGEVIDD